MCIGLDNRVPWRKRVSRIALNELNILCDSKSKKYCLPIAPFPVREKGNSILHPTVSAESSHSV